MKDKTKQFDQILKQFATGEELNDFLKSLQKRGVEKRGSASPKSITI